MSSQYFEGYMYVNLFIFHMTYTKKYTIGDNNNDLITKNKILNGDVFRYYIPNHYF